MRQAGMMTHVSLLLQKYYTYKEDKKIQKSGINAETDSFYCRRTKGYLGETAYATYAVFLCV
ncbi:hypothetical protein A374_01909 [Fictibacillus macauensis ZFHKF-1]|uniref:Uncharacterized protein n=1 Tax=Fictibacillus macauensis ZFHKF-1 TaxID=1196324 RepID=I8J5B8_9BACL|nr:hypothetical protein [Fictibacillus macauensis]EIT86971.1 hypothetical protein A374_01909 [Fictibacillus macauensis ZFHKF-1]